jgi:hypothetical protein
MPTPTKFKVTLNRWTGDTTEKLWIRCAVCNIPASVVEIAGSKVCHTCLNSAIRALDDAILVSVS